MADRYARLRRIEALDPERDGAEIRRLSADDFYDEYEEALQLALFRTFAVPTISLSPPPPLLPRVVDHALRLRARAKRRLPAAADGSGRRAPETKTYPHGYAIEDLGPAHVRRCPHVQ